MAPRAARPAQGNRRANYIFGSVSQRACWTLYIHVAGEVWGGGEWFDASRQRPCTWRREDDMSAESGPRAVYGAKKKDVPGVLGRSQNMYNFITANIAMFVALPITMVAFLALITALVTAQQNATGTKAKGSATLRNTKRNAVWSAMGMLRSYVQSLADALDPEGAAALIEAAGLLVAAPITHHKAELAATLGTTSGTAHLEANASLLVGPADASKKALFNWQMSANGGQTWTDLHATPYANTDVPGLTLLTTYSFRASVTIGKVTGPWSQAVSLLVH
jgi:hypothetical protein